MKSFLQFLFQLHTHDPAILCAQAMSDGHLDVTGKKNKQQTALQTK